MGFKASKEGEVFDKSNYLQYISPADLKAFGLIPELIGRLPIVCHLDPLDKSTLRSILTEPKNALIKQYEKIFHLEGISLTIDKPVFDFVVDKAMEFKLGARGLRSICEAILLDAMYELPSQGKAAKEFHLTLLYAKEKFSKVNVNRMKVA
jgi:ATP-dependent Clp protease ATP-binding subunit ClpX